ncbi:cell adhesion molecule CEACAM5-like [Hemitrygon akajei]|uniref:cell adhesion molecule CEACAM5-like n=1 Tax=Hemitrygon akajei TaxID=2704970 RepID=UPI003BF9E4E3
MSGLPFAAIVLCLHITAGESQQFTIFAEHSEINATVGGDALFSVRPSGKVTSGNWRFNGGTIAQWIGQNVSVGDGYTDGAEIFTTNGSLLLKSVNMSDSGEYRVNMVSANGSQTLATVTLRVFEPVSNVIVTSNATRLIEYSDTVRLTCSATGTDVSYLWLEENNKIIPGGRIVLNEDNSTLTVSGVLRTDGNFTCRASNVINEITSAPFSLNVNYGPDRPYIITQPNSSFHVAGSSLRLTCFTESRPDAELNWQLNGAHLHNGQEVILDSISVSNAGKYTCEASNSVTKRNNASATQINVFERVSNVIVTSNATRLIEYSDTVTLTCSATGTDVSYLWLEKNSKIIPGGRIVLNEDNSTLTVSGVLRTDGRFTCRASNVINEITSSPFSLHVNYGPDRPYIITQPDSSYHVAGSSLRLTCFTESRPDAKLNWKLNGASLQSEQEVIFDSISVRDTGKYTCEAYNRVTKRINASTTEIIVFETVTGVTVVVSDPTPLEDPDTIALSCHASGTVQTRTWFKDNQPIQENGRIFTSPDKAKLTIIRANRNDAGTYKCIASNSFSSGAGETNVQVYYENCTFRAGAIVGIIFGLLIMGLVGGFSGWLFARKAGGLFSIKYPPKSKYGKSRNPGSKSTFDTKTVNSSEYYENVQMDEQGARNNAQDEDSTYTPPDKDITEDFVSFPSQQLSFLASTQTAAMACQADVQFTNLVSPPRINRVPNTGSSSQKSVRDIADVPESGSGTVMSSLGVLKYTWNTAYYLVCLAAELLSQTDRFLNFVKSRPPCSEDCTLRNRSASQNFSRFTAQSVVIPNEAVGVKRSDGQSCLQAQEPAEFRHLIKYLGKQLQICRVKCNGGLQ